MKSHQTLLALLVTSLVAVTSYAGQVRIDYSATLTQNNTGFLGTAQPGDVFTGSFIIDTAQAGTPYSDPGYGAAWGNPVSNLTLGSETVTNPFGYAQVADNSPLGYYNGDLVSFTANYPSTGGFFHVGGTSDVAVGFLFYGSNAMISEQSLAGAANLDFSSAYYGLMTFYEGSSSSWITQGSWLGSADITSWQASAVPEGGLTSALLGASLLGLAALRRRVVRA